MTAVLPTPVERPHPMRRGRRVSLAEQRAGLPQDVRVAQVLTQHLAPLVAGPALRTLVQTLTAALAPFLAVPATRVPRTPRSLSERELDVLRLVAEGMTNARIGARLMVAEDTVKMHNRRTFRKLGARDRAHAVALAMRAGLLDGPAPEQTAPANWHGRRREALRLLADWETADGLDTVGLWAKQIAALLTPPP